MPINVHREVSMDAIEEQDRIAQALRARLRERFHTQNKNPLAMVHTFGCQQNVADGEKLKGILAQMGFSFTDSPEQADLILFNTCASRENAETKVFGNIGNLKQLKAVKPALLIGICGCMTEQPHVVEKLKKSYSYVGFVFGSHSAYRLPSLIQSCLDEGKRVFRVAPDDGCVAEGIPALREEGVKAWLPIMYGCDNFCSYCVVPYVRGRERSRRPERILEEFKELVQAGYKDITLLGQNVNSYGKGLEEPVDFSALLERLNAVPGDFRIRFMTSHPKDCSHRLIDTIAKCEKVCNHIHLPVQSGSSRILREMNRHYDRESYLELVRYAREKIPDVTLTSDFIVGFRGETYEEFRETLSLLEEVKYISLYTFIFSPRLGTRAASLPDPVSGEEKGRWFRELLALQDEIGLEQMRPYIGQTVRVLAEDWGKAGEGLLQGRTESNLIVEFPGPPSLAGQFVRVKVESVKKWALLGNLA